MCKNRDFALYGLWRPYKATKSHFLGIINVWGSSLGSRRNLHIGFIMGCRGGFSRKMQKTGGGGGGIKPTAHGSLPGDFLYGAARSQSGTGVCLLLLLNARLFILSPCAPRTALDV